MPQFCTVEAVWVGGEDRDGEGTYKNTDERKEPWRTSHI